MMRNWDWGNMGCGAGWGHGFGWLLMILFWLAVILVVAALLKWLIRTSPRMGPAPEKTALDILKERYARGDIDREEFEQKKRDLIL